VPEVQEDSILAHRQRLTDSLSRCVPVCLKDSCWVLAYGLDIGPTVNSSAQITIINVIDSENDMPKGVVTKRASLKFTTQVIIIFAPLHFAPCLIKTRFHNSR